MTIKVLISTIGHVLTVYNYFLPPPILYLLCLQQVPQLVMIFYMAD